MSEALNPEKSARPSSTHCWIDSWEATNPLIRGTTVRAALRSTDAPLGSQFKACEIQYLEVVSGLELPMPFKPVIFEVRYTLRRVSSVQRWSSPSLAFMIAPNFTPILKLFPFTTGIGRLMLMRLSGRANYFRSLLDLTHSRQQLTR